MHLTSVVLSVAWSPLLSGCMAMGGLGHVGNPAGMACAGHEDGDQVHAAWQRAEASNRGFTIGCSTPSRPPGSIS